MQKIGIFLLLLSIPVILLDGCRKIEDHEKYRRPEWLAGKLFTVVETQDDLSTFTECLRIVGLDTILDVSGCWTIFAPSNEAMDLYLAENQYGSIYDIPREKLVSLTEFHIIQNPWSEIQLKKLDINGWVDPYDPVSKPYAYKRQTMLKHPNEKYWTGRENNKNIILNDSTAGRDYKWVFTKSRKYVPIFYDEFFDIYNLTHEDYQFYFDRLYEPGSLHYAGARAIRSQILAENGFVFVIDRVVNPMKNAKEFLEREEPGETYKLFLDLVYQNYPIFEHNKTATDNQPAVRFGGIVDTLWDLSFSGLSFDIHEELTGTVYSEPRYTLGSHNGLYVPTDYVFKVFVDEILTSNSGFPHWPDLISLPGDIIHIIVDHHFFDHPLYSSHISQGLSDGDGNLFFMDEENIIRKEFGSNCTFIGLNEHIPSRVFTSVAAPVFLRPKYSIFRLAMQYSGAINRVSNVWADYAFFPIPDGVLESDSSLILDRYNFRENDYTFLAYSQTRESMVNMSSWVLRNRILNQVGMYRPDGSANKEFIRTVRGNYLIWNNSDNTIQGSLPNTRGYEGTTPKITHPAALGEPTDNGKTWAVDAWFNFDNTNMLSMLLRYPAFRNLLMKAGLYDSASNVFPFLQQADYYTIFIPSEEALLSHRADTLAQADLADFLLYHFIPDNLLFTDNKSPSSDYYTLREEDTPPGSPGVNSSMNIRYGPDIIEILDSIGDPYVRIPESEGVTNIMVTKDSRTSAVIHEINEVLIRQ